MKVEECTKKMNGFQFGSSIYVKLCEIIANEESIVTGKRIGKELSLSISDGIIYLQDETSIEMKFKMDDFCWMPLSKMLLAFYPKMNENGNQPKSFGILFGNEKDLNAFRSSLSQSTDLNFSYSSKTKQLNSRKRKCAIEEKDKQSEFDSRTEEGSASQYFQFYGSLFQQQNMMQDYNRTATYQRAINENYLDFKDKIILDVGAGSGILSFFAAQAGAHRIYAVEGSSMSLVAANGLDEIIKVIPGKIEEIELPEQVDVIISEPMGYMLVNERMLESYVYARKYLRKGGRMYPSQATLHIALFNDEQLYIEQITRSSFWAQEFFHGVNLSSLKNAALDEVFHQPIVDSWHIGILVSKSISWSIDFEADNVDSLHRIEIPFEFTVLRTGYIHGIATWFDVGFFGQKKTIWLSTAPTEPLTHWYQVRCLLKVPMFAMEGQLVKGKLLMVANEKQSYDLELEMETNGQKQSNNFDLKMPHFRYNGQPIAQPPGNSTENPSEQLNLNFMTQMNSSQSQPTKNFTYCDFLANSTNIANGNDGNDH